VKLWNSVLQANDAADFALALGLLLAVPLALALAKRVAVRLTSTYATGAAWGGIPAALARATSLWALLPLAVYAAALALAAIAPDKPFVVGDFIVVDSQRGTVENVGLKTTRVRSLDGELLVFSSGDLLKSRVRNFKRMRERRIQFGVGVTYGTPADKLRSIPRWLREAVEAQPKTRFDRAHFKQYGGSSLDFEAVYYVLDPDYNVYMDVQQSLNLAIYERFAAEGVDFAFPTHTGVPARRGRRRRHQPSSRA